MPGKRAIYLDSCVLIDFIERPPTQEPAVFVFQLLEAADRGEVKAITSVLTIAEVCFGQSERGGKLDDSIRDRIDALWNPAGSPINLIEAHELVARAAQKIVREGLARGWSGTSGADSIHLMTAHREGVDEFWTSDDKMEKWGPILGYRVVQPHALDAAGGGPTLFEKGDANA